MVSFNIPKKRYIETQYILHAECWDRCFFVVARGPELPKNVEPYIPYVVYMILECRLKNLRCENLLLEVVKQP